ncbi:MAG: lysozyme [Sphingobium sp.]|nr:lysozyme [Sphingobium sp.]
MTDKEIFAAIRARRGAPLLQADVDAVNAVLYPAGEKAPMTISQRGIDLIKRCEGLRLSAYPDPGTGGAPWTIGYGHTGPEVRKGLTITQAQADTFLVADIQRFEADVRALCPITTQGQFDALVSFAYNVGQSALSGSTMRKKHVAGNYAGAAAEFDRWVYAGGRTMAGLVARRAEERALYEGRA